MSKRKKRRFIIAGIIAVLLLLCFTGWKISLGRGTAIEIPVDKDTTCVYWGSFPEYKILDRIWCEEKLGDSGITIGEEGDFLCCVCSVIAAAGENYFITPDKVNALLCELYGYSKHGDIKKDVLKAIAENVTYHYFIDAALENSEESKDLNDPPVAFDIVKVKKGGDFRWIVLEGFSNDGKDYRCMDPRETTETCLADYGSRVYEWYTVGKLQDGVNIEKKESVLKRIGEIENRKRKRFIIVGEFVLLIVSWIIGRKIDHYMKQKG